MYRFILFSDIFVFFFLYHHRPQRVMGPLEDIMQRNMSKYDGDDKSAIAV